ncbi:MAG: NADH-quinone oxidoreductase subunit L [Ardenticatenaceae bacterium]|nr:NADH-quinone oxidoreductase subunit L [Ardenticatenaceae bacterium]
MNAFGLAPLLLIFPLIGVLFNGLVGRRFVEFDYGLPGHKGRDIGERWSGWFGTGMALSSLVIAVLLFISLLTNDFHSQIIYMFDWFNIPSAGFHIPWSIQVDTLSVTMMLVVTGVGSLIHIYAIGYMHGDPNFSRFFAYFNLFIFFMLILVSGSSYLMLFVGWEGVGLCSYLLIGFWWDRVDEKGEPMNANAGRKAFVVNRVGDLAMILAMTLLFWTFGSLDFNTVFTSAAELFHHDPQHLVQFGLFSATIGQVLTAVTALFLMGAAGKSAQIPLYVWLPDAMAGPTPVSALIHAATMVTSGIYLMVRSNVLYEIARESGVLVLGLVSSSDLVAYIGAATALVAGLIAFTQFDIKKVLAYSTVSQLGFMVAAAGMGAYVAAMFHLITHAFFKALLFLSAGSVIHGMEHGHHHLHEHGHHDEVKFDPQDMRTMGGLKDKMRTTYVVYMIGALALAGVVPLAGFWSKDEILSHGTANNYAVYIMLAIAAVFTAFYMGRQLKMVFFGEPRHEAAKHAVESVPLMTRPLIALATLATLGGLLNLPFFTEGMAAANHHHPGGIFLGLEGWLEHSVQAFTLSEEGLIHLPHTPIVLSPLVAGLSTVLALGSLALAFYVVYAKKPQTADERDPLQRTPIWWFSILPFETFYSKFVVAPFKRFAHWCGYNLDWYFWHDFVHNRLIRDIFVGFSNFASDILDMQGVDGLVNGAGKTARRLADTIRLSQTGYARNYALSIFLGAVALLAYFLLIAN